MIVCLCNGISSRKLADEARLGARTVKQLLQACKAGSCCGACVEHIRQILESTAAARLEHHTDDETP